MKNKRHIQAFLLIQIILHCAVFCKKPDPKIEKKHVINLKGAKLFEKPDGTGNTIALIPFGQLQEVRVYPNHKTNKQLMPESYYEVSLGGKLAYLAKGDASDMPPIVDHKVNAAKLIGSYQIENYNGTPSKMNLSSDGSAALELNFCHAMERFQARWHLNGTTLVINSLPNKLKAWVKDLTLSFYVEPNGTLHYMGEDVYACNLSGDWNDDLRLMKRK